MPPNLKQRLAALSLAPSSPSLPLGAANIRKPFLKRASQGPTAAEPNAHDRVQDIMPKVIFQAGVDYETRPMVIISASALPDPSQVLYDVLLSRILAYLDLYVESDYTVVFFAAGGKYAPSWNWVWKAYRSLSRKYRKNLKRLYIIHSSFFSKMLFSLAGAVISPKFFRKIVYIDTLSELAHHVPLTQIDIPPAVYQENLKHERQISMPIPIRANVFGVALEELMGCDGEKSGIPRVIRDAIQYIRESGMKEEGLFRRSPNSALLRQVQQAYDRGQVVSLETFDDPHLAAVLIKKYLRDLPDPPFPEPLYPLIRQCPTISSDPSDMVAVTYIRDILLPQLMPCVYILLSHILHLLHEVSLRSASNRMDAHNLAVVVSPNLVKGSNPMRDVMMCAIPGGPSVLGDNSKNSHSLSFANTAPRTMSPNSSLTLEENTTLGSVVKLCIQRYYEIFDDIKDRSEPVAVSSSSSAGLGRISSRSPSPPRSSFSSDSGGSLTSSSKPIRPPLSSISSMVLDDEDSIDDAMLVMPIGPGGNVGLALHSASLSEDRQARMTNGAGAASGSAFPYQPRQRKTKTPGGTIVNDPNVNVLGTGANIYSTRSRVRSTLSIEKPVGNGSELGNGRGSISIRRGSSRKASGSGVETVGITAGGFFTPPASPPSRSVHSPESG